MCSISLNFDCELQEFGRKFPLGQSRHTAHFNPWAELLCDEERMCRGSCTAMVAALALLLKHHTLVFPQGREIRY